MSRLKLLQGAKSLSELAPLLGLTPKGLSFVIYRSPLATRYVSFDIPKRGGGTRTINAPTDPLKRIQKSLSKLLQDCADEIRIARGTHDAGDHPDTISHGFRRKRDIGTNASRHRNRRHVFNLDLEGFFPACNFGRVSGILVKDKNYALHPKVAQVIAHIACLDGKLPQGSPSSPCLSNLIAHGLDMHLARLAQRTGFSYTRYADDLTFSTNLKVIPREIAVRDPADPHIWVPGRELERLIVKSGFAINPKKTRMQYLTSRQQVTGLVVNERVNVRREYRSLVRAMVHRLVTTGSFEKTVLAKTSTGAFAPMALVGKSNQLQGMLGHIDAIDYGHKPVGSQAAHRKSAKMIDDENAVLDAKRISQEDKLRQLSTYGKFLLYEHVFAAAKPVIVAEGKTDNVYLTMAIRGLAKSFPSLASIDATGKITLLVRPLKYSGKVIGKELGLFGGAANLVHFLKTYHAAIKKFAAPAKMQPVIIVVDNDPAGLGVKDSATSTFHKTAKITADFIHLTGNLYLVVIPPIGTAKTSCPEDLFDATAKALPYRGLKFDPAKDADSATTYGKSTFAHKVVVPNAASINFNGFKPLLERLEKVIVHHKAVLATLPSSTPSVFPAGSAAKP